MPLSFALASGVILIAQEPPQRPHSAWKAGTSSAVITPETLIGASDKRGEDVTERPCGPGDFLATIHHLPGIDSSMITIDDFNGRHTPMVDHGRPIPEMMV